MRTSSFHHPSSIIHHRASGRQGFTLIELMLGSTVVVIAVVALLGASLGQSFLNAHARTLHGAMSDATRVMEQIRQRNTGADWGTPSAAPPVPYTTWDAWLIDQGPSLQGENLELVVVTCASETGEECRRLNRRGNNRGQVGRREWRRGDGDTTLHDPIRVTVTVGCRIQGRIPSTASGETEFRLRRRRRGDELQERDRNDNDVIEGPAMLTTLITCRS